VSVIATRQHREIGRIDVGEAPAGCVIDQVDGTLLVSNAGSNTLMVIDPNALSDNPSSPDPCGSATDHPLVGRPLPRFCLPDLRTGKMRSSLEWAQRLYVINFFASW
jgi:hypothetical protein